MASVVSSALPVQRPRVADFVVAPIYEGCAACQPMETNREPSRLAPRVLSLLLMAKKLTLKIETIRTLSSDDLERAVGGQNVNSEQRSIEEEKRVAPQVSPQVGSYIQYVVGR